MIVEALVTEFVALVQRLADLSDDQANEFVELLDNEQPNPHGLAVIEHFLGEPE